MANNPGGQKLGGSRLFIGNLPPNATNKDVEDIFAKHGKVLDVRLNRKFCFVQFEDEPTAQKAIDAENGQVHLGRKIDVQFARAPKHEQRNQGDDNDPGMGGPGGRDRSPIGGRIMDRGPGGPPMRGRGGFSRGGFGRGGILDGDRFGRGPPSDSPFRDQDNFRPNERPFRDSIFNRPEFTTNRESIFGRGRDSDGGGFGGRGGPDGPFGQRGDSPYSGRSGPGSDFGGRGSEGGMPGGGRMPPNEGSFGGRPGSDGGFGGRPGPEGFGGRPGNDAPFGGGRESLLGRPPGAEPFSRNESGPGPFGGPGAGGFDGGFPPRRGPPGGPPDGEPPFGRDNMGRDGPGGGPERFGRGPRGDGPPFNRPDGSPFRGGPPEGGFGGRGGPLLDSPFPPNRDFRGRDEPPPRGGPPFRGGEFNGRDSDGPGGWAESWDNQFPPTQAPEPLATSNEDRANDIEIIVCSKNIIDYGEFVEGKLKSLGFSVDVLFPNEAVPIERVLSNIASRGTLYAIVINPVHQSHWSLTLHILHGTPQEHRNIPVEDAVALVLRNFDAYSKTCKENRPPLAVPEQVRHLLEQIMAAKGVLTSPQYEILIQFFKQEKIKVDPLSATTDASKEAQLQNRILNILNKNDQGMPPPANDSPTKPATPLLNDPSVQKALDSLMQGDILRKISNPGPNQPVQPFNRF